MDYLKKKHQTDASSVYINGNNENVSGFAIYLIISIKRILNVQVERFLKYKKTILRQLTACSNFKIIFEHNPILTVV